MRTTLTLLAAMLALAGCSTMRHASGAYGRFAEKGVGMKTGEAAPAAPAAPKPTPLPEGLAGDGEQHSYVEVPRSS